MDQNNFKVIPTNPIVSQVVDTKAVGMVMEGNVQKKRKTANPQNYMPQARGYRNYLVCSYIFLYFWKMEKEDQQNHTEPVEETQESDGLYVCGHFS